MRIQARVKFCLDPFGHQLLQLSFRVRNQFYFCFYLLDPADPEGLRLCRSGSETLHCSSGFRSLGTIAGARPIYFGLVPAPGDITVNGMPELTLNPFICRYSRKTRNYSMLYSVHVLNKFCPPVGSGKKLLEQRTSSKPCWSLFLNLL